MALFIRLFRKISLWLSFLVLIAAFLLVIFWNVMVQTIPVGHAGVVWQRILLFGGSNSTGPLSEGLHIILPWNKIYIYDLRLQSREHTYQVLSKDGLAFEVELSFRWRVAKNHLVELNQVVGPDYIDTLMSPEIGSVAREVIAQYTAEALFTDARAQVQRMIYDQVTAKSLPNGIGSWRPSYKSQMVTSNNVDMDMIILTDILIKRVTLPERIEAAIENKLEQAQLVGEYKYRVAREALESERKRVEAEGIRSFQEIVTPAISESYLRWRGIDATLKLAQSPNSKIVVIGNSATGMPLILDTRSDAAALERKGSAAATGLAPNSEATGTVNDKLPVDQSWLDKDRPQIGAPGIEQPDPSGRIMPSRVPLTPTPFRDGHGTRVSN